MADNYDSKINAVQYGSQTWLIKFKLVTIK